MQKIHTQRVNDIASQVKDFYARKKPFHIYHGSTNSTRILSFKRSEMIDVSALNNILSIDRASATAVAEPNVPMDKLVKATLKKGLIPKIVMEFPGITVGGGIQGGAGESSSFRYGCFNQICNAYEMILADGTVVRTSEKELPDLFYGTAGSFGTLGIIAAAEIQLVPAKKYVQLTYLPVTSFQDAVDTLERVTKESYEYIDGIMFSATQGVIIVGVASNEKAGKVRRFSRAHDTWYYLRAQQISENAKQVTETVPIVDYLFRYDRGGFWVGRYAFGIFGLPFNKMTRWLLNPFMHTRKLYQALQESGASQRYIVQDLALPLKNAVPFMHFVDSSLGIYPLWLCPLKTDNRSPLQSNNLDTPLVINVGVWGNQIDSREIFIKTNRAIEDKLSELKGKKWFYAHSYYTKDEFWSNYNKKSYDKLRQKYNASALPDVFDKISVSKQYDVNLKQGALKAMQGLAKIRITD